MSASAELTVAVVGGGRWARALAATIALHRSRKPGRIAQVLHHRPTARAQESLISDEPGEAPAAPGLAALAALQPIELDGLTQADLILLATPARAVRALLRAASPFLHGGQHLVHAVGSLAPPADGEGHALISKVVRAETPIRRIGALAGPALAQDLETGNPAALLSGSRYDEVNESVLRALAGPTLRIYTTRDLIGVEVARAMVSVVALASGVAHALGLGAPARAILITRGAAEMARLGVALGGSERTFFGLAGVGELVIATDRGDSADFELGRLLGGQAGTDGRGLTLEQAQQQIGRVCDGPTMVAEAHRLAMQHKLRMPIVTALRSWLAGGRDTQRALSELFASENHAE